MLSLFLQAWPLRLYCIGLLSPPHYFFLVYYRIFKLKRSKSKKKTIHLPPKEEEVFLEILDKLHLWSFKEPVNRIFANQILDNQIFEFDWLFNLDSLDYYESGISIYLIIDYR